jgi:hypothetical protein
MNTIKIITAIVIIVCIGVFTLNFFNEPLNEQKNSSQIIGTWNASEESINESVNESLYYEWSFFENETVRIVISVGNEVNQEIVLDQWYQYSLISDTLLEILTTNDQKMSYTYSLSEDSKELSLSNDNAVLIFYRAQ